MIRVLGTAAALVLWVGVSIAQTPPATFEEGRIKAEAGQYDRARDIWTRLARDGDADSQNGLGFIYQKGLGVLPDYSRATQLYTAAAEQGHVNAANNLGFMYTQSRGVPRDYARAYSWYSIAAILGEVAAIRNRNILARAMSYKDLKAANKISFDTIGRIAKRLTPEQIVAVRDRAQSLLAERRGADAHNAMIVTVPRTRLEGASQGLVEVPDDTTGAVLAGDVSDELEEDAGPKLPSLTPLN
jgi:TPR repeat protein